MLKVTKSYRTPTIYLIAVWMVINVLLMLLILVNGDYMDLNNWIELGLWSSSILGLLSMKKWGFAFATFTLCYTLSTSVGIIIYYQVWLNALRVAINIPIIVYMFRKIFEGKFN